MDNCIQHVALGPDMASDLNIVQDAHELKLHIHVFNCLQTAKVFT